MLQGEHSAILSTFFKLPFVIKIFVLSIFEWPFYTGFTVISYCIGKQEKLSHGCTHIPRGGTLNFSCYVGLDPASTVYPKKLSGITGIPKKIFEILATPKNIPIL